MIYIIIYCICVYLFLCGNIAYGFIVFRWIRMFEKAGKNDYAGRINFLYEYGIVIC
jgi:hypothetical protein